MNRCHRTFVAGVHGLQHVEGLFAAALAEDDAVGAHAQRVLDELTLANFTFALNAWRASLHAPDMRLLQLQFGGVLDGDEALLFRDERGQRVEHRGFAGAGAAGNDGGDARLYRRGQQFGHRRTDRANLDKLAEIERLLGKFADRDERAVDADRAYRDVDARTILQARVAKWMRFIDAAADGGNDLVDDPQQMILVLEADRQRLEDAVTFDIDAFMAVDQDIVDGGILQQRLEWS